MNESSLNDLYASSVKAFPKTTKRQHIKDSIGISEIKFIPFLGVKTLFVKALATNENRNYNPVMLFKNVQYGPYGIEISGTDGKNYELALLSLENNDVLLRCQCGDFSWRFNYTDYQDKSLYANKRKKYEAIYNPGSSNPKKLPGMCKHLMAFSDSLLKQGLLKESIF